MSYILVYICYRWKGEIEIGKYKPICLTRQQESIKVLKEMGEEVSFYTQIPKNY